MGYSRIPTGTVEYSKVVKHVVRNRPSGVAFFQVGRKITFFKRVRHYGSRETHYIQSTVTGWSRRMDKYDFEDMLDSAFRSALVQCGFSYDFYRERDRAFMYVIDKETGVAREEVVY